MFYDQFYILCKKQGTTPTEFTTKILKLSSSKVTAWKKGSIPKYEILQSISEYFGVTIGYLFDGETQKPAETRQGNSGETKLIDFYNILNDQARAEVLNYVEYMTTKPENLKKSETKRAI